MGKALRILDEFHCQEIGQLMAPLYRASASGLKDGLPLSSGKQMMQ